MSRAAVPVSQSHAHTRESTGSAPNWTLEDVTGIDDRVPTWSILLVEMLDDDTVRLERFDATEAAGISPGDVTGFTVNARTYHRNPLG